MYRLCYFSLPKIILFLIFFGVHQSYPQCSPQVGPPPSNFKFNTGSDGSGNKLSPGSTDLNWQVAEDSITGVYQPAIVMDSLPPSYFRSPWTDCYWISTSAKGTQLVKKSYFYKFTFNLPCTNPCGVNYNDNNSFCLALDLFADNSIYEIYVNGIPQSGNLGNIIPVSDPYEAPGSSEKAKLLVSLCHNWNSGPNTLIIQVASSPPVNALLVQASTVIPPQIANFIVAAICQGDIYHFGNQNLSSPGYAIDTIIQPPRCDSLVLLHLMVRPRSVLTIDQFICAGQSYLGHSTSGTYIDTFPIANACDSIRTLNLTVLEKPNPGFGTKAEICTGDSLILSPGAFLSYRWQDSSTLDHLVVNKSGRYSVTVTDACGSGSVDILVTEKYCFINFPNAFTPNQDGKNDYFKILTGFTLQNYNLSVYNRRGQKVFETGDQNKGWDGNYKGQPMEPGTYVWYCRFMKSRIKKNMKGTLVLIR